MTDTRRQRRLADDLELIEAVYDAAPIGVAVWTVDGHLMHANPVLCQLLGRPLDELQGVLFDAFIDPAEKDRIVALIADLWAGRRNHFECDLACRAPDDRELWLRAYFAPIYGPDAEPAYVISHIFSFAGHDPWRDHLGWMADRSPVLLWLTDPSATPWLGNRAALEFLGGAGSPSGLLGRGWTEAFHADDLDDCQDVLRAAVARHEPFAFEARFRRWDGVWRWLRHEARPVHDAAGRFQGYAGTSIDVTDRRTAVAALGPSGRLPDGLTETGPVAVARTDADGRVTYHNARWSELLHDHHQVIPEHRWHDLLRPEDVARIEELGAEAARTGRPFTIRLRAARGVRRDCATDELWGELRAAPEYDGDGAHTGFVATLIDVSAEVAERARADRLAAVLDASLDYVLILGPSGEVTYANGAATEAFFPPPTGPGAPAPAPAVDDGAPARGGDRTPRGVPAGVTLDDLLEPVAAGLYRDAIEPALRDHGVWRGDLVLSRADGSAVPVSAQLVAHAEDGALASISVVARDISDQVAVQEQLRHLATHDRLTGLANRALLYDRLAQALARRHRSRDAVALLYCDLDHFKPVNDQYGHATGDAVLVEVARRIAEVVRETDTAARVGGDEFVVLVEGVHDLRPVERVADRLLESIGEPVETPSGVVKVTASIGLVVAPDACEDADQLMGLADRAMYRAKAQGRARVEQAPTTR